MSWGRYCTARARDFSVLYRSRGSSTSSTGAAEAKAPVRRTTHASAATAPSRTIRCALTLARNLRLPPRGRSVPEDLVRTDRHRLAQPPFGASGLDVGAAHVGGRGIPGVAERREHEVLARREVAGVRPPLCPLLRCGTGAGEEQRADDKGGPPKISVH